MIGSLAKHDSKRLLIVAHPDDETLWAGGLLIRYPGDWSIICCSQPKRDPIRAVKFHLACSALRAQGRTLACVESRDKPLTDLEQIDFSDCDLVVTHGSAGEYGHQHHKQVHEYVMRQAPENIDVIAIGYGRKIEAPPSLVVELTDLEYEHKIAALQVYDHEINWGGKTRPTWDALLLEYGTPGKYWGYDLKRECYDCYRSKKENPKEQ